MSALPPPSTPSAPGAGMSVVGMLLFVAGGALTLIVGREQTSSDDGWAATVITGMAAGGPVLITGAVLIAGGAIVAAISRRG